jgi:hypothetical protein
MAKRNKFFKNEDDPYEVDPSPFRKNPRLSSKEFKLERIRRKRRQRQSERGL